MWPDKIIQQFQVVHSNRHDSDFLAPYNKLLHTFFPPNSDFTVVPQCLQPSSHDSACPIIGFEIQFRNWPVLILELKCPSAISACREADDQIRRRMGDLVGHCPLPTMHAVSAIGTALCFYSLDTADANGEILPLRITYDDYTWAPANQWEYNILGEGGEAKLWAIIEEVLQGCAALPVDTQCA